MIGNAYLCKEEMHCTWIHSKHYGEEGLCLWKNNSKNNNLNNNNNKTNYLCSDLNQPNECSTGGGLDILSGKCELFENVCSEKCELFVNKESCLKDGVNDCVWMRNSTGNSSDLKCIHKVYIHFNKSWRIFC
jgi:hypothetical protein